MRAKLCKTDKGNYVLTDPTKGTYDKGYMLGSSRECDLPKLSLKNCQSIENGYDLDELAIESSKEYFIKPIEAPIFTFGYEEGFQKALELMGDKKFSEEDIKTAIQFGWDDEGMQKEEISEKYGFVASDYHSENINPFIQSLQQTEWDVEVEMEFVGRGKHGVGSEVNHYMPKRDSDGCLILKRLL